MISRLLPLTLFIVVLAPGLLHAQTASSNHQTVTVLFKFGDTNNDKMYEDIEIFRRILGRELQPLYPRVGYPNVISNPFTSTAKAAAAPTLWYDLYGSVVVDNNRPNSYTFTSDMKEETLSSLEGVFLKGQGVVYTATLSSLQPSAKSATAGSVTRRVEAVLKDSEWESVRRQVRSEKEKPKKPEASKPPSLSDVLLNVLAENGHNFSQLGENESLTLVLTVHQAIPSAAAPKSGTGSAKTEGKTRNFGGGSDPLSEQRDLELLGELHLKQGKHEAAIQVYERAIQLKADPNALPTLYRRLAQCYLALGQDEKAEGALHQLRSLLKGTADAKDKPPPAVKPAAALPVKLIIAVLKKQLDEVKQGKITFEEFRRQAHVETLRFGDRR